MKYCLPLFLLIGLWLFPQQIWGHELRPGLLYLSENQPSHFKVVWKVPALEERVLRIEPQFPESWEVAKPVQVRREPGAVLMEWEMIIPQDALAGSTIVIRELERTLTDVWLILERLDGTSYRALLKPEQPRFQLPEAQSSWRVFGTYLETGGIHTFEGLDHLLFLWGLMMLLRGWGALLKAVTSFTLAHSLTLSAATLHYMTLPPPLVEATIAMSVVFLAVALVRTEIRVPSHETPADLMARYPWAISFFFGLIHGFGFAGALSEIGLPHQELPLALLGFNLGVEMGQLGFLCGMLVLWRISQWLRFPQKVKKAKALAPGYIIGSLSSFFLIQRVWHFN